MNENQIKKRRIARRQLLALAAIGLLAILAYRYFSPDKQHNNQKLFAAYYEPYQMVLKQRSGENIIPLELQEAIQLYVSNNYAEAAAAFIKLSEDSEQVTALRFYAAVATLLEGEQVQAIPILEDLVVKEPHLYIEQVRWYLALAYLKEENSTATREMLKTISPGQFNYEKASALLEQLR